jgi:hypothetical protein
MQKFRGGQQDVSWKNPINLNISWSRIGQPVSAEKWQLKIKCNGIRTECKICKWRKGVYI